jgi:hypothetical protein
MAIINTLNVPQEGEYTNQDTHKVYRPYVHSYSLIGFQKSNITQRMSTFDQRYVIFMP